MNHKHPELVKPLVIGPVFILKVQHLAAGWVSCSCSTHSPLSCCWIFHPQSRDRVSRALHKISPFIFSVRSETPGQQCQSQTASGRQLETWDVLCFSVRLLYETLWYCTGVHEGQWRDILSCKLRCLKVIWDWVQAQISFRCCANVLDQIKDRNLKIVFCILIYYFLWLGHISLSCIS